VPAGVEVGFDLEADRKRFFVTENGLVVIPKRATLDDEKVWRLERTPSSPARCPPPAAPADPDPPAANAAESPPLCSALKRSPGIG
jgi:glucose-1-phosphate adenylyltransferase